VVALNVFASDTEAEKDYVRAVCNESDADFEYSFAHAEGGAGTKALAEKVLKACERSSELKFVYALEDSIENKINTIAQKIYGADSAEFTGQALTSLALIKNMGYYKLPVCMAKTQYSLSDNPKLLCRPTNFKVTVKDLKLCAGAGFIVAYLGDVLTMPGLPAKPAAEVIDLDNNGDIVGLF
jgi:formate--tetrahydrofolate ligase